MDPEEDQPLELEHGETPRTTVLASPPCGSRTRRSAPCLCFCRRSSAALCQPYHNGSDGPASHTAAPPPPAAIGYTGQYRQTLLLHPTEPSTTVFAIGCTVVLGKLDDP